VVPRRRDVGTAIGVLPGLGPALTIALLLPLTYKVEATSAFILFAGIYYGAMYGGSTTSILLNTPGESATIVTSLEGNRMARNGRAGRGAGDRGHRLLRGRHHRHDRPHVRRRTRGERFALKFGPAEYFSLMVLAFVTVSAVLGNSALRGLTALSSACFSA
jgi:putative tricarboxylic transport membrane protein